MKERIVQYILRIFSAIYNPKVFIFFSVFYYVINIVEVLTYSDYMLTIICHRESYLYRAVICF